MSGGGGGGAGGGNAPTLASRRPPPVVTANRVRRTSFVGDDMPSPALTPVSASVGRPSPHALSQSQNRRMLGQLLSASMSAEGGETGRYTAGTASSDGASPLGGHIDLADGGAMDRLGGTITSMPISDIVDFELGRPIGGGAGGMDDPLNASRSAVGSRGQRGTPGEGSRRWPSRGVTPGDGSRSRSGATPATPGGENADAGLNSPSKRGGSAKSTISNASETSVIRTEVPLLPAKFLPTRDHLAAILTLKREMNDARAIREELKTKVEESVVLSTHRHSTYALENVTLARENETLAEQVQSTADSLKSLGKDLVVAEREWQRLQELNESLLKGIQEKENEKARVKAKLATFSSCEKTLTRFTETLTTEQRKLELTKGAFQEHTKVIKAESGSRHAGLMALEQELIDLRLEAQLLRGRLMTLNGGVEPPKIAGWTMPNYEHLFRPCNNGECVKLRRVVKELKSRLEMVLTAGRMTGGADGNLTNRSLFLQEGSVGSLGALTAFSPSPGQFSPPGDLSLTATSSSAGPGLLHSPVISPTSLGLAPLDLGFGGSTTDNPLQSSFAMDTGGIPAAGQFGGRSHLSRKASVFGRQLLQGAMKKRNSLTNAHATPPS
jgi:hypothetical protein